MCHSGGLHHREPCPPSQPTTAASAWKTLRVERTQRPPSNNHSPSQQPAPANQASAVRVPECDWTPPPNQPPRLRASRKLLGACVSALHWSLVAPFHPPRSRPRASHKIFCDRSPVFALLKKRGLPLLLSKPQELPPRCTPPPTITSAVSPLPLSVSAGPLAGLLFLG